MPEYLHPKTKPIPIRLTPDQIAAIDRVRGGLTRSDFIRSAILDRVARSDGGDR